MATRSPNFIRLALSGSTPVSIQVESTIQVIDSGSANSYDMNRVYTLLYSDASAPAKVIIDDFVSNVITFLNNKFPIL